MIAKLSNPFKHIAGFKSLWIGILIILATACVGYFSHTQFPDLISVKTSPGLPLWYLVVQSLSNWAVFSGVLYLFAVIVSPSSVRIVDVFGTQALARFPYLFASVIGFSGAIEKFGAYVLWTTLRQGEPVRLSLGESVSAIALMICTILLTVWLVVLMYNAFKISANLKGAKSGVFFIIAFVVSIVVTNVISNYLLASVS